MKRRILSLLLSCMMMTTLFGSSYVFADESNVSSNEADIASVEIPSYITKTEINGVEYLEFDSGEDMAWLREHVMNREDGGEEEQGHTSYCCKHNIILTDDIDMTDYNSHNGVNNGEWSGIGHGQNWIGYSGIFDGNGHTISNIDVYTDQSVGPKGLLFNITRNATIKNLVVQGKVEANRYVGGLIGRSTGSLTLENVVVDATLLLSEGNANAIGGLVGQLGAGQAYDKGTVIIDNCVAVGSYGSETASNPVGGLIGHIYGGFDVNISNTYAAADLNCSGGDVAGLIAGQGTSKLNIKNCYYLDTIADTSLIVMTANGDPSPIGPESDWVDVKSVKDEYMKSDDFLTALGEANGQRNFHSDGHPPLAQGYPLPAVIEANDCIFSGFNWTGSPVTEYRVGEAFDLGTLKVVARYRNEDSQFVDVDVTKYVTADKDILKSGDNDTQVTLSVEYDGNSVSTGAVNASKSYTVKVRNLQGLKITSDPATTEYYEGQTFSTAGLVVTGVFDTGDDVITGYTYSPSGPLTMLDTEIVISYQGKSVSIPIKVHERAVSRFEIRSKPTNLIYAADEEFDPSGMIVCVYYDYAPNAAVNLQPAENEEDTEGKYTYAVNGETVTVNYTEKGTPYSESFNITILQDEAPDLVDGVYQLSTADQVVWFANQVNALKNDTINGILLNDIDLSDAEAFVPIGAIPLTSYKGIFNGDGHKVNLDIDVSPEEKNYNVGFFGSAAGATIRNLIVTGTIDVNATGVSAGGIAGTAGSRNAVTVLENCINKATINNFETSVNSYAGGLLGSANARSSEVKISNCINEGNITTIAQDVAGILGHQSSYATCSIVNCFNSGNITNSSANVTGCAAGIATYSCSMMENCGNSGMIVCENGTAGGISAITLGRTNTNLANAYNTGEIKGGNLAGGIVASLTQPAALENSYSAGNISVSDEVSGKCGMIIGNSEASDVTVKNTYYNSDIAAESNIPAYNEAAAGNVTAEALEAKSSEELKNSAILDLLGENFTLEHSDIFNNGYPILSWQAENIKDEPSGGGGGGGGGSTTDSTQRDVTVSDTANGTVSVNPEKAKSGDTVTVTVTPDEGYVLESLKVTDADGDEITVTGSGDTYTFRMPASAVSVEAVFAEDSTEEPPVSEPLPFTDVSETAWYYDDVRYAYENGLMTGTAETAFSPSDETDRAMIVTILWRLEGSPESAGAGFDDVAAGAYYADAVAWASGNGIVEGYEDGNFRPSNVITREELATIIYRYAAFKEYDMTASADLSSFTDADQISSYALSALRWANAEGLVNGVGGNLIDPKGSAQRSQVAAIFSRFCQNIAEL